MRKMRWQIAQFFERRWWRNYLKGKSPEEYLEWKTNYWKNFLGKMGLTSEEIQDPIIDIGCGPAGIFTIFPKNQVSALDPLLIEYEELEIFNQRQYPLVHFISQSFEDYQVESTFQTVFCLNAINHFIDLKASFEKLNQITATKGELILSVDAHNYGLFRYLFAFLPLDILHPHQYNLAEYVSFIEKSGFSIQNKVLIKKAFFFSYWVVIARKR